MGAWGPAILSDDLTKDVHSYYMEWYDDGKDHTTIRTELELKFNESIVEDTGEAHLFWLALAKAQWVCGVLQPDVKSRVEQIISTGDGLDVWEEQGEKLLAKRKAVLDTFLKQISTPRKKPRKRYKPPKPVQPIFQAGDCLAIDLGDGTYGALLVLAGSNDGYRGEGLNLIAALRYQATEKPSLKVFERRDWLLSHNWGSGPLVIDKTLCWCMARLYKRDYMTLVTKLEKIGTIPIRSDDPQSDSTYGPWDHTGEILRLMKEEFNQPKKPVGFFTRLFGRRK